MPTRATKGPFPLAKIRPPAPWPTTPARVSLLPPLRALSKAKTTKSRTCPATKDDAIARSGETSIFLGGVVAAQCGLPLIVSNPSRYSPVISSQCRCIAAYHLQTCRFPHFTSKFRDASVLFSNLWRPLVESALPPEKRRRTRLLVPQLVSPRCGETVAFARGEFFRTLAPSAGMRFVTT